MNTALYIAKRIAFSGQRSFSRFIIRLSIAATALSVAAMILTMAFVNGFQQTVSQKVFSFWGHIRVQGYEPGKSLVAEENPITKDNTVEQTITDQPGVERVQAFATKSVVLQSKQEIEGLLMKGIEQQYDSNQLHKYLVSGRWLSFEDSVYSREIMVSAQIAAQLNIATGDTLTVYFISNDQLHNTYRKLKVAGIYKTGIEEYDKLFVLGDLRLLRRVNSWEPDQIGGYEVFVNDHHRIDSISYQLSQALPLEWESRSIREVYPNIFDWLGIQDVNRNVIFVVMSVVAIINLITCLLILILERTRMIGVLKAVGAADNLIRRIFLYHASVITAWGIGLGLFAGLGLAILQQQTGFIKLDESSYYVATAPIQIIWWQITAICVATALVCFLALIIPTWLVKKVQPIRAIQFR